MIVLEYIHRITQQFNTQQTKNRDVFLYFNQQNVLYVSQALNVQYNSPCLVSSESVFLLNPICLD